MPSEFSALRQPSPGAAPRDILVVEDEAAFRDLLSRYLELAGYTVMAAPDGRTALKLLAAHGARLLVTDLFMPDTDGIELLTQLRRVQPGLPIVVMSGSAGFDLTMFLRMAQHLGARHTLTKPFPLSDLRAAVEAELGPPR
ncbi:MAG TPA: response regulator [Opitutus sp.]|nr:response regulator [Opitutus sp.]